MKFSSPEERRLYNRRHSRVVRERGRAALLACSCGEQARCWAQLHDTNPDDVNSYEAMCYRCHNRYDAATMYSPERNAKVGKAARRMWAEADDDKREAMAGNATGPRGEEQRKNIQRGSVKRYETDGGNGRAYGKRTPEQCERIRVGRWGGDA